MPSPEGTDPFKTVYVMSPKTSELGMYEYICPECKAIRHYDEMFDVTCVNNHLPCLMTLLHWHLTMGTHA